MFKSEGEIDQVLAYDGFLAANKANWLAREIRMLWKRVLKRIDLTSRSLVAIIEPGSCFAGTLAEIPFACDRSYMLIGQLNGGNRPPAAIALTEANFGAYPMPNGISRLESRFLDDAGALKAVRGKIGEMLEAEERRGSSASSRLPMTTSTGKTRSASSSKSARASRPTASPASKPICASAAPKRWN